MDNKFHVSHTEVNKKENYTQHMAEGLKSCKYRSVDYDRLRAELSEKKFGSIKASMKLAKIERKSQQHKENTIVKQHRLLWQKEFLRLHHLCKKIEADVETHMRNNRGSEFCEKIYKDLHYYDSRLSSDFEGFKKATASPVWSLRDDLRYFLVENREELKLGSPEMIQKHAEISALLAGVKSQQQEVMEKLFQEQQKLDAELQTGVLTELFPSPLLKHITVSRGVPKEAISLPCPDTKLKSDVLQEFIIVDEKYESVIANLRERYALAISSDEFGGWEPGDHFKFVTIYEQYPAEIPNRRKLLFDRLKRHLPNKCRIKLSEHEDWWMDFRYYHERLKVIYSDWARHKLELTDKARFVFSEAAVACELEEVRGEYYQRQKQLCEVLYERVKEWRERKMEAMQLETQINEERRRQMEINEAQSREAENRRRSKEKENISHYQRAKDEERRKLEQAAELRLKELKKQMEEQASYDRERIQFREEQLSKRIEEQRKKQAEKVKENEEIEARLEALRAQVRVIAESDPLRAIQGTKAWEAHQKDEDSGETPMLMPLFKVNGYTSNQITSDHRVRLEQRLREAGLHTTDYARQMIQAAAPPKPPRRDLQHTFKFKDQ